MRTLDELANDPGWHPSPKGVLVREIIPRPSHMAGEEENLELVRGDLNNGLPYALVQTDEGRDMFRIANYNVSRASELSNGHRIVQLTMTWVKYMPILSSKLQSARTSGEDASTYSKAPVFSSTFQYEREDADGNTSRIIYIVRHHVAKALDGLSLVQSLSAEQEVNGGKIIADITTKTTDPKKLDMIMRLSSSGNLYGSLDFDEEGKLSSSPHELFALDYNGNPFGKLRFEVRKGARVDVLKTAEALVKGFDKETPLNIMQSIQYDPQYFQPRLL